MTVNHNAYLDAYNEELGGEVGTHYLKYPKTTTTEVAWFYGDNGWVYQASNAPVYIDVVHEKVREEFTVTYTDGVDGEEVFADEVYTVKEDDATPAFQGTLERKGYVFAGWTPAVTDTVTKTVVYTATWKEDRNNNGTPDEDEEKYTVTYTDGVDGEEVFADQIYANLLSGDATPAFQGTPERKGYDFKGWNPQVADTVSKSVAYTAIWEAKDNGSDTPKTGDSANLTLWVSLMAVTALGAAAVVLVEKKKHVVNK